MSSRNHTYAQHFIRSPRIVAELVGHSNVRKNDTVYDLGAGSGVITSVLARRVKQVIAVEVEPVALKKLVANTYDYPNVTIVRQDILALEIPTTPYKIFSNIPFNLSADVVRKFTETDHPPKSLYLIVQRQFARKLVPGNDHFTSVLSAQIAPQFIAKIRKPLRKTDFTPPPAVDTVLLEIKPREEPLLQNSDMTNYREFVARCFSEQKFFAATPRAKVAISPEKNPSQLSVTEWVRLYTTTAER